MAWCCELTAVTPMRWLGVLPSDFDSLEEEHLMDLSAVDQAKLKYVGTLNS